MEIFWNIKVYFYLKKNNLRISCKFPPGYTLDASVLKTVKTSRELRKFDITTNTLSLNIL